MRKPRQLKKGAKYHVSAKINRDEHIFEPDQIKYLFMEIVKRSKKKYKYSLENFVIMNNHIHFLIKPDENESLSKIMQWILSVFAIYYNKIHILKGHVWRSRLIIKHILIIFSIYLLVCFALARVDGGHIEGYVFNIQGRPISDVYVVLPELGSADVTTSNGYFRIEDIPSGTYVIKLNHISYRSRIIQNIEVYSNSTTTVDTVILESYIFDISDIAVTASRSERSTNRISSQINTVSENEIKARNAKTSAEVLREESGIFVQKTNHGGGSAVIRGLSSNQILIMVDGIKLNNSTYRLGNHQYLTTVDNLMASQIEVVRGPTSVLYGSDALGGVINVISKQPSLNHSNFELDFKLAPYLFPKGVVGMERAEVHYRIILG